MNNKQISYKKHSKNAYSRYNNKIGVTYYNQLSNNHTYINTIKETTTYKKEHHPIQKRVPISQKTTKKEIRMCSSPETKFKLNIKEQKPFYPRNFKEDIQESTDTLQTASTSRASLVSQNSASSLILHDKINNIRKESLEIQKTSVYNSLDNLTQNTVYKYSNCCFNKFNTPAENSFSENTPILCLKIKIAQNDYRIYTLRKYDDLFISLQKFFSLNQINDILIKPIVNKIFLCLDKIFWVMNSKIGKWDIDYLNSLNRVWIKNKGKLSNNNLFMDYNNNKMKSKLLTYNSFCAGINDKKYKDDNILHNGNSF